MPLIARNIAIAAYATSTKNQPTKIATEGAELVRVVQRAVQGAFAVAARVNPSYYGDEADVASVGQHWPRPSDAESVWRIENPAGEEVVVVPRTDLRADVARPAVYRLGNGYYPAGNALDPALADTLTFLYSARPAGLADISSTIDERYPDELAGFLEYEVALYLALKDGRADDAAAAKLGRDHWLALYVAHLEHETVTEVRRFAHTPTFHLPSLMPLLAGGGS